MSTTRTFPCCPACGRPFTRASGGHIAPDAPVPVAREVEYSGREPGRRGGGIRYGRTFGAGEVTDGGVLSILTHWRHRLLHVAEALGLVVEREVRVEVESQAAKERIALLERQLSALVSRADTGTPHRPRKRAKVRAGARRMASLYGTPARASRGRRGEDGLGVAAYRPASFAEFEQALRPAAPVRVRAGTKTEDGL